MAYDVAALEKLIEQFQKIPSIGRKTAQRMAFHVLDLSEEQAKEFALAINPKIIIPMHYKTAKSDIDIDTKEQFLSYFSKVKLKPICCINSSIHL